VASNLKEVCWRPERGEVTCAGDTVAFTVSRSPAMDGLAKAIHCDVLNHPGMWRTSSNRPTPVKIIPAGRRPSGYGELNSDRVRANPCAMIFYSPQLSTLRWARIVVAGANPGAGSPAAKGDESGDLFQLLYIGNLIQSAWPSIIGGDLLQNLCGNLIIHLYQSCWATIHLQFCYSILSKILIGSCSNLIPKFGQCHRWPYFSPRADWQPDFKSFYLQFLYNTNT
jgi:hypothetical protein